MARSKICPCCSGLSYAACCKPFHRGKEPATALQLMRSRYSAYALGKANYIQKTTHPQSPYFETDQKKWNGAILELCRTSQFIKLEILDYAENWVLFVAHLKQCGKSFTLLEKSQFEQINSRWRYVRGEIIRK